MEATDDVVDDIRSGACPAVEHGVPIDDAGHAAFLASIADPP